MAITPARSCEIFASVVTDGTRGTFVPVLGVERSGPKVALWTSIQNAHPHRLRGVDIGDIFLYGPQSSASGFPDAPAVPTSGRVIDTAGTVDDLVGTMPRAYFLVHSNAPPALLPAISAGAPRRVV